MTSHCAGAQGRRWQLGWGGTACEVTERGGPFQGSDVPLCGYAYPSRKQQQMMPGSPLILHPTLISPISRILTLPPLTVLIIS